MPVVVVAVGICISCQEMNCSGKSSGRGYVSLLQTCWGCYDLLEQGDISWVDISLLAAIVFLFWQVLPGMELAKVS